MREATPGPWKVKEILGEYNDYLIVDRDGKEIAFAEHHGNPRETIANTHRLAAAQDLLEALELCLELMQEQHINHEPAYSCALNAIAKARGEV